MREITEIIIHCTATPAGRDYTVDSIRRWHKKRGFADIGYHYVVHPDGRVEEGRPVGQPGAHCQGHNAHSIGIAYIGGLAARGGRCKNTMTPEQEQALAQLVRQLQQTHQIGRNIHGHNEYTLKRCPCFDVQEWRAKWGL